MEKLGEGGTLVTIALHLL